MTSLDTNVVVRFLVNDDPHQSARARALIEADAVWVSKTVLLETDWVLRGAYDRTRADTVRILTGFLGLAQVAVEDEEGVARALRLCAAGMDFADALHLVAAGSTSRFATFDRDLRRRAARDHGSLPVIEP